MRWRGGAGGVNPAGGDRYDRAPVADVHPRPAPARTGPLAASSPARRVAVVVAVVSVAWVALVAVGPVGARPAQDPGVTSTLAFDGSTTVAPTGVAPTDDTMPTAGTGDTTESTGAGSRRVADENRKIWAVVAGLVLVAIALSLLTIRYWRRTRPVADTTGLMLPTDAALAVALASEPETGPPAGESSSGEPSADASGADEPSSVEVVEPPGAVSSGLEVVAGDAEPADTGADTAPVPVVDVSPASPRRAVAGADHASADEAWEPRGTGEHERVVVAPAARPQRLSAEQRAALFARREPRDP